MAGDVVSDGASKAVGMGEMMDAMDLVGEENADDLDCRRMNLFMGAFSLRSNAVTLSVRLFWNPSGDIDGPLCVRMVSTSMVRLCMVRYSALLQVL